MQNIEKPYYKININSLCASQVYVNDICVSSFLGKQTNVEGINSILIPINNVLLESGKYKVIGKMYPRYGEKLLTEDNAFLGIEFFVSSIHDFKNIEFHPSLESPWDGLSENINFPYYEIITEIEVELPFVLDGWQNSVNLKDFDKDKLFKDVLSYYQQIRLILKEHNVSKFLDISKEKMKLQEQAFYFTEERKKDFLDGAAQLFNQKLEVEELIPENLKLEIMGYGKLVRLMRKDGTEALQFKSPNIESQSNTELEIKLHMRNINKGFTII